MDHLHAAETPCLIVDVGKMTRNIRRMAETAAAGGVRLRPHAKTHKTPSIAKLQLEAGAAGITVAKIAEAEVMARHGIDDIFIAFPIVSPGKLERVVRLAERIGLILGVDSVEGARLASEAAARAGGGAALNVRLEIDIGLRRTGVPLAEARRVAASIAGMPHVRLTGIYTYRGAFMDGKPTMDLERAGREEGRLMADLAEALRSDGIDIADVSVGSTPTAPYAAQVEGVTEIRPGTYVFYDRMQAALGVCSPEECAAYVSATVVSVPADDLAIIDGGSKTFATDVQPGVRPLLLEGFGAIAGAPASALGRMTEEHGMITIGAADRGKLRIGDRLAIVPNHICSTINLHNHLYLDYGGRLEKVEVAARGMLE